MKLYFLEEKTIVLVKWMHANFIQKPAYLLKMNVLEENRSGYYVTLVYN